jgi:hypothetical protein
MRVVRARLSSIGRVIGCFGLLFAFARGGSEACAQTPSRVERFENIVQGLYASGVKVERPRAIVWFSAAAHPPLQSRVDTFTYLCQCGPGGHY